MCSKFQGRANIMTPYEDGWYLLYYQWKEESHSYTLVAIRVYRAFSIENLGRGCNKPPPLECVLKKYLRRTRKHPCYKADYLFPKILKEYYSEYSLNILCKCEEKIKVCYIP